ncbi:GGDEF domain-containing protein [Sphingomonas sp. RP10(2022)]|uniref:diguanylate cyclase n=1 Tax=Sphingomonas liriopis TaxID=2949094 RepID=A0A9X2HWP9_9SPHN|nr:GGDEF domain-containing protein [Sphingomonas liriopis]MCP3733410.1 GGDEF domain-containing protein [Sphingomonas liriopis]
MTTDDGWAGRLVRVFGRLAGFPVDDAVLRADLIHTMMLRPLGVITASMGFMMVGIATAWTTGAGWAIVWLIVDAILLTARLMPAIAAWRARSRVPERTACAIMIAACLMFTTFGIGCAASFATGIDTLRIASTLGVMALLAGLATRWAGLPRLGIGMVVVVATPMTVAFAAFRPFVALLFVVLVVGTAVLAMQNNRTIRSMLAAERRARLLAETDSLTGLLNRAGLEAALAALPAVEVALLYLDLDGFKGVNDRHGHAAGDRVLAATGARLHGIADGQPAARLGGDEFVLVLTGEAARTRSAVATALRRLVAQPVPLDDDGGQVQVGVSIGIASGSLATQPATALLAEADAALYAAKRAAKARRQRAALQKAPHAHAA